MSQRVERRSIVHAKAVQNAINGAFNSGFSGHGALGGGEMQQVSALASRCQAYKRLAQRNRAIKGPLELGRHRELARRFERHLRPIALEDSAAGASSAASAGIPVLGIQGKARLRSPALRDLCAALLEDLGQAKDWIERQLLVSQVN